MPDITEAELEAIAARAEAATPGEWKREDQAIIAHHRTKDGLSLNLVCEATCEDGYCSTNLNMDKADTDFICMARADVPRLVDEVKRLRSELEKAERERDSLAEYWADDGRCPLRDVAGQFWCDEYMEKFRPRKGGCSGKKSEIKACWLVWARQRANRG